MISVCSPDLGRQPSWCDESDLARIKEVAQAIRGTRRSGLEALVPLYISNYCDSICSICAMRRSNASMERISASPGDVEEQLLIIRDRERVSAVLILTGEHFPGPNRERNLDLVQAAVSSAFRLGFQKVRVNIGALAQDEIAQVAKRFHRDRRLGLSLFQETYDAEQYARHFGRDYQSSPKANFLFRLSTPERWLGAGFRSVNLGVLLGLSDAANDIKALIRHATDLHQRGADVEISLPRIRGVENVPVPVSDAEFTRFALDVAEACPWARLVITTRESIEMIRLLLPVLGVLSPGTSEVLGYTHTGPLTNRPSRSQFVVCRSRPRPSWILREVQALHGPIKFFGTSEAGLGQG